MSRGDGLARVLAAHRGKRRGAGEDWMLQCPAHEDSTASLHLTQGREGVLLYCHAGCSTEAVCAALGIEYAELFDDREAGPGGWRGGAVADDLPLPVGGGSARPRQRPQEGRSPAAPAGSAAQAPVAGPAPSGAAAGPEERQPVTIAALAGRFALSASWLRDAERGPGLREERGSVLVPYRDEAGRELFAKRRVALAGRDKYRMPRGQALALYGLDRLPAVRAMRRPAVAFVEGECLPGDAEVLTVRGWVRLDQYAGGRVCEWSPGGSMWMVEPMRVTKMPHCGEMVKITNRRGYYAMVTPTHKLPLLHGDRFATHRAADRPSNWWNLPRAGRLDAMGIEYADHEIALVIAICADSKVDQRKGDGGSYVFFDLTKQRKIERLRMLLQLSGIEYRDTPNPHKKSGARYIKFHLPPHLEFAAAKKLPWAWVAAASLEQRKMILAELTHWDGNSVPNRNQTEFSARDWPEVSWVQAIAHTSGIVSTLIPRKNRFGSWWKASLLHGKSTSNWLAMKVSMEPWDDDVYCLTVPSGFFLVRQNGCVTVTGNSDCWCLWEARLPALGVPGASAAETILAAHVRGLRAAYVVREPDEAGARFAAAVVERLRQVGYDGEPPRVVEMPGGFKDPGELRAADPGAFAARFRAACAAAPALDATADVDDALLRMDTVARREVTFLWKPYIPAGKLTILAGLPGDGKSTIAAALSASITVGAKLENSNGGPTAPPAGVLYFLAEDDPEETFGPRLEDNGADRSRVWAYNLARRAFTLEEAGYDFLRRAIVKHRPALVVFDPLSSFFGRKYNPDKQADVRAALHPLVALVQETGCSCLAIAHPRKGASLEVVYRVAGSGAFGQIVRSLLSTYRDPAAREGEQAGVLAHAKHNLSAPGASLRYVIEGTRLYWRGTSPLSAHDLAHAAARPEPGGARAAEEAVAFLREELRRGARYATDVQAGARGAMVSKAALLQARADLGVRTFKATAAGGGWMWRLPAAVASDAEEREERDGQPSRERRREGGAGGEERDDDGEAVPI